VSLNLFLLGVPKIWAQRALNLYGAKKMNMISTGAFLNEMDASNKQPSLAEQFAAVWEKKNAKAARAGGVSLMALSLAACGSSSSTTTTTTDTTTDTTTTVVTPTAETYTLTVSGTSGAGDNVSGGAGDDTIVALTSGSFEAGDVIDGGAGTDTLQIGLGTLTAANTTTGAYVSNVENVRVTFVHDGGAADAITLNVDGFEGVEKVTLYHATNSGSTADGVFTVSGNNMSTDVDIEIVGGDTGADNSSVDVTATYNSVTGTADSSNLILNSAGVNNVTLAGIETVNLSTLTSDSHITVSTARPAGTSSVNTVTATSMKTLNVTGAGNLTIGAMNHAATFTMDASAATGNITVTPEASTVTSITTGSGNDKIVLGASYATNDTIAGGAGTDTLSLTVAVADPSVAQANVTGIEVIEITDGLTNDEVDVAKFGTITRLELEADGSGSTAAGVVTGLASGATILFGTAVDAIGASNALDVNLSDAAGAGDTLTLDINNTTGAGNLEIDATGVENLIVDASGSDQANDVVLTDPQLTTLTITNGTGLLSFEDGGNTTLGTIVTTVDASSTTKAGGIHVVLSGSALNGATVTGTKNADTIDGSSQADTIRGGDGIDTLDGGAGADRFVFEATGTGNDADVITLADNDATQFVAGSSGDILDFSAFISNGTVAQNSAASTAINEYTSSDTADFNITNKLALYADATEGNIDTAAEIAALIDGANDAFSITAGGKAILVTGDVTANTTDDVKVWYIHDSNSDGVVSGANEVVQVLDIADDTGGTNTYGLDLDTLITTNFDLIA